MKPLVATYRVQLSRQFTFHDLIARVDYLQSLNISHLYLSPVMEAASGSNHGYDVTDFAAVSRERGGEEGLRALDAKLRGMNPRMHMILDIVPNHMAAGLENRYWRDVLMNGVHSPWWKFFDLRVDSRGKIEIPVLRDLPGLLIASGDIRLDLDDADIVVCCSGATYPADAESQARLKAGCRQSGQRSLADYLRRLPPAEVSDVLNMQHYAFVPWQEAGHTATYRRFFNIAGLVALRMEDRQVFEAAHAKLFELARELPSIAGVRVDHVDGLAKPRQYLEQLSAVIPNIWVEKILSRQEEMRDWACHGTTGYEFIDRINLLMTEGRGFQDIESNWKILRSDWKSFDGCVRRSKQEVLEDLFPAELDRLAALLDARQDLDLRRLRGSVSNLTVALPVYRVYDSKDEEDRALLRKTLKTQAPKRSTPEQQRLSDAVFKPRAGIQRRFFSEWQRLTGPVMAKGLEDRAHYRYTPLASFNEVGCSPVVTGSSRKEFCKWLSRRQSQWPCAMNAGTTHDTKRSEDARHRLYALADMPEMWEKYTQRVLASTRPPARLSPATVLFFLQAVVATWPVEGAPPANYADRIWQYMLKAVREGAEDTGWNWPDMSYESTLENYVRRVLRMPAFQRLTVRLVNRIAPAGAVNSLSALALRCLSAGVPDIYQGTEGWNLALVDPDNRAPVDFETLEGLMRLCADEGQGRRALLDLLMQEWQDGGIKMWLMRELLKIRRGFLRAARGDYDIASLSVSGALSECLVAYELRSTERRLAVIAPRYTGRLVRPKAGIDIAGAGWRDTLVHLPKAARAVDLLSGSHFEEETELRPGQLFESLPLAVLLL